MKKQITALLASCACLMQLSSFAASANTPIVTVSPGNMVFLDVVDPDGNSVENVRVNLHDAAGTLVGSLWNDIDFLAQNDSGIVGTEKGESLTFYVPWNTFPPPCRTGNGVSDRCQPYGGYGRIQPVYYWM